MACLVRGVRLRLTIDGYLPELVSQGKVKSGLKALSSKTEDFTGVLELMELE